jgi:hypothetical protein
MLPPPARSDHLQGSLVSVTRTRKQEVVDRVGNLAAAARTI